MVRSLGRVAPEFDLTSNRALRDLCGQPGIEDEFIGYLDGLAHTAMVAICYQPGKSHKALERRDDADVRGIVSQAWWPKPIAH